MKMAGLILIVFILINAHESHAVTPADINDKNLESQLIQKEIDIEKQKKELAEAQIETLKAKHQKNITESDLEKFGFGLGFGAMILDESDITSSIVENDIIRVTGEEKEKMGFWLTTSWISSTFPSSNVGFGPFFGVQLGGNNEIVNSIAAGIDFSFKRASPKLPLDIQFGYGLTRIKTLAEGYQENMAPPTGSSQALTKDTTTHGWTLIFSYRL